MSKYMEKAKKLRAIEVPHHNCAQSVLMSFTDALGIDDETAFKTGACFGGGMKCGSTCGVVTGGLMVLGLLGIDAPATTQKYVSEFKARHEGMLDCADLLKANAKKGLERKLHCDALVYEAVEEIEKIMAANGK